jgi:surface antigen
MAATEETVQCPSCEEEAEYSGRRGGTRGQAITHTYHKCTTDECRDYGATLSKDLRTGKVSFGLPSYH